MNIFETVKMIKPKRNTFNLSHEVKMSGNMGVLMPFACLPVMPNDKFRFNTEILLRYAPMIAPIMHRVNVYTHFFFVPNRLVWDNWETFVTGGEDGMQTAVMPTFSFSGDSSDYPMFTKLADYLGVNTATGKLSDSDKISQLPFRAYQLIYNEYYRDQNLTEEINIHKDSDGNVVIDEGEVDFGELLRIRTRAWEKDYFTSALPWTQRGPDVTLPVSGTVSLQASNSLNPTNFKLANNASGDPGSNELYLDYNDSLAKKGIIVDGDNQGVILDNSHNLRGQIDDAMSVTINELRKANALQRWYEKNARGGSRYIEQILSHFGVRSSDARLQRPEFLGGGKSPVVISEVLQTSESQTTPQGNMSGHGISASANHAFVRSFEEHGYIIGIMSVMPKTCYQQGLPRHFSIADKFDLPWPEFGHLGEQEILNKELYNTKDGSQDEVFGYTPRYAEYKYHPSRVAGDFKNTLNFWHLGRIFSNRPALNQDFVKADDPNMNRIFAVQDNAQDHLWIQIYNDIKAIRPLPKYGTPSM